MGRVTHFEIHADDPGRAADFYRGLFGWKVQKWDGPVDYWLVTTGSDDQQGINGAIMQRRGPVREKSSVIAYLCTIDLDPDEEIDTVIDSALSMGGTVAFEKHEIPGVGVQAFLRDTEGNIFGVHEPLQV